MRSRWARLGLGAMLGVLAAAGCGGASAAGEASAVSAPGDAASSASGAQDASAARANASAAGSVAAADSGGAAQTASAAAGSGGAAASSSSTASASAVAANAGSTGAAGAAAAGGSTTAASSGGAGTAAAAGGMATAAAGAAAMSGEPAQPTLPAVDDPAGPGPFMARYVATAPGLSSHALFVPSETGSNGKNPVVVWTCGNGGTVSFYQGFLEHLASHGFFVVADKGSSSDRMAEVQSQNDAIAWVLEQNMAGEYSGKLDVEHIAVMGHSLGSLASFATAAMNEHVAASVHYSGGLTGNPVGFDMSWLASMTKPAAFLCGGNDTTAGPACEDDFATAPAMLPVFYGTLLGADHIGPFGSAPRGGQYGRAGVAWLRWQLANDATYKPWFVGSDCTLCSGMWTGMSRNLQ